MAIIGSCLIDPDSLYALAEFLQPEHFYSEHYGWIYQALLDLSKEGKPIDFITVSDRLAARDWQPEGGWQFFLIDLPARVPFPADALAYGRIVYEKAMRRRLLAVANQIARLSGEDEDIHVLLERAEGALFQSRGTREISAARRARQYADEYFEELLDRQAGGGRQVVGLPTGFIDLDRLLSGLQAPFVYVLAGRPGMGKSAMAVNIMHHLALRHGKRILTFSLEMSTNQLMQRMVAAEAGIDSLRLKTGALADNELGVAAEAIARIGKSKLVIDPSAGITPGYIRNVSRRIFSEGGLDLIVIDHLHLIRPDNSMRRQDEEITAAMQSFVTLGKTLNVPILVLAQLSRKVEERSNKRPTLTDLRESGGIEENAFAVLLLYRDDYYNPETSQRPNTAEVEIAKHREGPTGTVDLYWHSRLTTFRNLQRSEIKL